jgi:V/A-type H+-transporting ATPase subunit F
MYSKIAVVGERELILSFKALGVPVFPAASPKEAEDVLRGLVEEGYALILLTDRFASEMQQLLATLRTQSGTTITPIPASGGSEGFALEEIKALLRKAVGVDIF